jgi:hypothetical protein
VILSNNGKIFVICREIIKLLFPLSSKLAEDIRLINENTSGESKLLKKVVSVSDQGLELYNSSFMA